MKRFAWMGLTSIRCLAALSAATLLSVACNWMPEMEEESGEGVLKLDFSFGNGTKSGTLDTNDFWLKIIGSDGELVYSGKFGDRPSQIRVKAGTYKVSALSDTIPMPAFEKPVYGDSVSVSVENEEETSVHLQCRMVNAGLKLTYSETFIERYKDRAPALLCSAGSLEYPYSKSGLETAYFDSGQVYFTLDGEYLFSKSLNAGEIRHLTVDASSDRGDIGFSITVDESHAVVVDSVKINEAAVLTVAQAKTMPAGMKVTVRGRVAGVVNSNKLSDSAAVKSNIVLADSGVEALSLETVLPVELKKSSDQDALSFDLTKGKWITVTGTLGTLYKTTALTGITSYSLE